jgi:hypothetical protein
VPRQPRRDFDRLVDRLRKMGYDLPEGLVLHRTNAGYWQRAQGAWSWYATHPISRHEVLASHYRVRELVQSREITAAPGMGSTALEVDPVQC